MSLFNIKIKTKNGNDLKTKETVTVFFRVKFAKSGLTGRKTAEYTYRIAHSKGVVDCNKVMEMRNSENINTLEDMLLKVILNLTYIVGKITEKHNINPDFIMFISPELDGRKSKAWTFLKDIFHRDPEEPKSLTEKLAADFSLMWNEGQCKRFGINKPDLDTLKEFVDINPNVVFMCRDPYSDKDKYQKSIAVCAKLQDRMDGVENLQFDIEF